MNKRMEGQMTDREENRQTDREKCTRCQKKDR